jgi:hypothetical protein
MLAKNLFSGIYLMKPLKSELCIFGLAAKQKSAISIILKQMGYHVPLPDKENYSSA